MASAIAFIQWENYFGGLESPGLFAAEPLTFNSRQERIHNLSAGDYLWLVSRCHEDQQYYFVAALHILSAYRNSHESLLAQRFGEFGVLADQKRSFDFLKTFPAEGLLRAFEFDSSKPIKFGANIGQSLQTVRTLSPSDTEVLDVARKRFSNTKCQSIDKPFGLWTKCDNVFAQYFLKNWNALQKPMAFLLYDSPPVLSLRAPVFIHSDKNLRLIATFLGSQFVAGHKQTVENSERVEEKERVWINFRANTIDPPTRKDFGFFWERQNGIRSLFLFENLVEIPNPLPFKIYGPALQWGYPMGVGYRYLTFSQTVLMLRASNLPFSVQDSYLSPLLM
jgi:hypothetical protein